MKKIHHDVLVRKNAVTFGLLNLKLFVPFLMRFLMRILWPFNEIWETLRGFVGIYVSDYV